MTIFRTENALKIDVSAIALPGNKLFPGDSIILNTNSVGFIAIDLTSNALVQLQESMVPGYAYVGSYVTDSFNIKNLVDFNLILNEDYWSAFRNVGYSPNFNTDGVTDQSNAIANAFALSKVVRLPVGRIKANFTVPSGCKLIGAGKLVWDRVSAWVGTGTLILGLVTMTGSTDVQASDFSIDNYISGNDAIDIKSDASRRIRVSRVSTRANNHNVLCEKNANTGNPATDAMGDIVNDIIFDDCTFNGGPNGIAIKMRGVKVRNCDAYDVTVQPFIVASDNINGAAQYSRARDVIFENCDAVNCGTAFRVYSRDTKSTTNANNVLGVQNVRWTGGRIAGCSSYGALIGDPATLDANQTRIKNIDVWVTDCDVVGNTGEGIFFQTSDGGGYDRCYFEGNIASGGFGVQTSNAALPGGGAAVTNLTHGKSNSVAANSTGYETGQKSRQGATVLTSSNRGILQTNYLAAGAVAITLPAPAEGDEYYFAVSTAQSLSVTSAAPATNRIRDGSLLAAGAVSSNTPGSYMALKAIRHSSGNLEWFVIAMRGTWAGLV